MNSIRLCNPLLFDKQSLCGARFGHLRYLRKKCFFSRLFLDNAIVLSKEIHEKPRP